MDILVDQSFPSSIELTTLPHLRLGRWNQEPLTDEALLELAAREAFQGVVFLGVSQLYDSRLMRIATGLRLAVLGTRETEPVAAATSVASNLSAIARHLHATQRPTWVLKIARGPTDALTEVLRKAAVLADLLKQHGYFDLAWEATTCHV